MERAPKSREPWGGGGAMWLYKKDTLEQGHDGPTPFSQLQSTEG